MTRHINHVSLGCPTQNTEGCRGGRLQNTQVSLQLIYVIVHIGNMSCVGRTALRLSNGFRQTLVDLTEQMTARKLQTEESISLLRRIALLAAIVFTCISHLAKTSRFERINEYRQKGTKSQDFYIKCIDIHVQFGNNTSRAKLNAICLWLCFLLFCPQTEDNLSNFYVDFLEFLYNKDG